MKSCSIQTSGFSYLAFYKQGSEAFCNGNGVTTNGNVITKSSKFSEEVRANSTKKGFSSTTHVAATSARAETKMSDDLVKESLGNNRSIHCKRKGSMLGSKRKRLRIDNEDLVDLKVTVVQAQGLMRPPSSGAPTVIVIEGCEIEEYEVPCFLAVYCLSILADF